MNPQGKGAYDPAFFRKTKVLFPMTGLYDAKYCGDLR